MSVSDYRVWLLQFQSTLPHGERLTFVYTYVIMTVFQSTLPHGERHTLDYRINTLYDDFNPRSRTGSDVVSWYIRAIHTISIHAPARGATMAYIPDNYYRLFQSTLPHGERHVRL